MSVGIVMLLRADHMTSGPIRVLVAVAIAGTAAALAYLALPKELDVSTDIVGYPIYANFNINRYVWAYALLVVFIPLATLALFLSSRGSSSGHRGCAGRFRAQSREWRRYRLQSGIGESSFQRAARCSCQGFSDSRPRSSRSVESGWPSGSHVADMSLSWARPHGSRRESEGCDVIDVVSGLNTIAAPITVAGLYGVSESTQVTVATTGVVHHYPWLPAWLAGGVAVALLVWLARSLARATTPAARSAIERRALLLIVAPVAVFLFVASLPGPVGLLDSFEEGQLLAGSHLIREGFVPWRDVLLAHGLLFDAGNGLVGIELIDDSRWGIAAGLSLLVVPLSWVALYYLCAYLFGANWLFLLGTQLLVFTGDLFIVHTRFLLLPFALVVFAALLQRPTVVRAVGFAFLLAAQVIVSPEAMVAAVAFLGTLVLFEGVYYGRGRGLVAGFHRTLLVLVTLLVLALVWSSFLAATGTLDDWAFSFTTMLPGHALTGGIPFSVSNSDLEVVSPIVLVLGVFAFVVARTLVRRPLAIQDWVMVAMATLTLLYYTKFLGRANQFHLDHSYSVAVPLLLYVAYRAITFAERSLVKRARARGLDWFPPRHTVTTFLLFALLLAMPVFLPDAARAVPGSFRVSVPAEPARRPSRLPAPRRDGREHRPRRASDLGPAARRDDTVFDFANAPGSSTICSTCVRARGTTS